MVLQPRSLTPSVIKLRSAFWSYLHEEEHNLSDAGENFGRVVSTECWHFLPSCFTSLSPSPAIYSQVHFKIFPLKFHWKIPLEVLEHFLPVEKNITLPQTVAWFMQTGLFSNGVCIQCHVMDVICNVQMEFQFSFNSVFAMLTQPLVICFSF